MGSESQGLVSCHLQTYNFVPHHIAVEINKSIVILWGLLKQTDTAVITPGQMFIFVLTEAHTPNTHRIFKILIKVSATLKIC